MKYDKGRDFSLTLVFNIKESSGREHATRIPFDDELMLAILKAADKTDQLTMDWAM